MTNKIYTMSDMHVDYKGNFDHLLNLNDPAYAKATLIVAGDATDDLGKLEQLLSHFKTIYAEVFFVPGNHELWVRRGGFEDSVSKFWAIVKMCERIGVQTQPKKLGVGDKAVWVVPLFSWYTKPEEGEDSLYYDKSSATNQVEDETEAIWSDNFFCRWTQLDTNQRVVDFFLDLNVETCQRDYDAPVISFSHFLPRQDLIFPLGNWRQNLSQFKDPLPQFNFTSVAGSVDLDSQVRQLGSLLHIYGHQHRNRHRKEKGITYISHCFGYPKERSQAYWRGDNLPKLIWDDGEIEVESEF